MSFDRYLREQLRLHVSVTPTDIVKLCYQAAYGPEHLLEDTQSAKAMLEKELGETSASDVPLYETISDDYVRINLAAWKKRELPSAWLLEMFKASAVKSPTAAEKFEAYLTKAGTSLKRAGFSAQEWISFLENYREEGIKPVHHSEVYREKEQPAYRVVSSHFVRLLPILEKVAETKSSPCVIAIDGRAASGKTTMAKELSALLKADVVQMDDFFLPKELRTPERLAEAGGNIHYERFEEEVLPFLHSGEDFNYRLFSCHDLDYAGYRIVKAAKYIIVEGSYSMHPRFEEYADVSVFSTVGQNEQQKRIFERDGNAAFEFFKNKWIPMEEHYFDSFSIAEKCNVIV